MALQNYLGQEWKRTEVSNGCFDCNICLDFAKEPVVTLCGHLYCWACIYKWLHVQSASLASDEHPQCPVCKADISHTAMVPLYGRGQSDSDSLNAKPLRLGMRIPPRPGACDPQALTGPRSGQRLPYRNPYQTPQPFGIYTHQDEEEEGQRWSPFTGSGHHHPVFGMVYARVFGNADSVYEYPNTSYGLITSHSSPRLRRQEMQVHKSLNRITIFLFCCVLLCLIVF